jgi:hypothetical protein
MMQIRGWIAGFDAGTADAQPEVLRPIGVLTVAVRIVAVTMRTTTPNGAGAGPPPGA